MTKNIILFLFVTQLAFLPIVAQQSNNTRYKIGACDWMMLKRQKIGEFQLAKEIGADGIEMDMGGLGSRDQFDNKLRDPHFQYLYPHTADSLGIEVPSVAMSGFFGQSFLTRPTYKELVEDCLNTMQYMEAKVAFLPLGGSGNDWHADKDKRSQMISRLHEVGEMAVAKKVVIGIRTGLDAKSNVKLLKQIKSKGIKIYYNFQDASDNKRDLIKELKILGRDRICQIHASNTDSVTLDKDTRLDMPAIKRTLDKMGWTGWLVIERSRDVNRIRDVKYNYSTNVAYLKEVFQNEKP